MSSKTSVQKILFPFQFSPAEFPAPEHSAVTLLDYKSTMGSLKSLFKGMFDKKIRQAESWYNRGVRFHAFGTFQDAERAYHQCLEIQEDHVPAKTNLAVVYISLGESETGKQLLKEIIADSPESHQAYYNLGVLYLAEKKHDDAIACFEYAISANPECFWALVSVGEIFTNRNNLNAAIECYTRALGDAENRITVQHRLSELFFLDRQFDRAEEILRESIKYKPDPVALFNLAWLVCVQEGNYEEAAELFQDAKSRKRGFKEAVFNEAIARSLQGDFEESVERMKRFIQLHKRGDADHKYKHLTSLVKVNSQNFPARTAIIRIFYEQGDFDRAIHELIDLISMDPDNVEAYELLAKIYIETGEHRAAIRTLKKILSAISPDHLMANLELARIYAFLKKYDESVPYLKKIVHLDPNNTKALYELGTLLAQQDQFKSALAYYKKVESIDAFYPKIKSRIRMVEEELLGSS